MGAQRLVSREEKAMLACLSLSNLTDCRKLNNNSNNNNNNNNNNNVPFFLPVELMQCSVVLHLMEDLNHVSEKSFLDTGLFTSHRPPQRGHNSWIDVTRIVDFLIDIMLTPVLRPDNIEQICNKGKILPTATSTSSTLSEASTTTSSSSAGGGGGGGGVFLVPPGLSPQRLQRLVGKRIGDDDVAFVDSWTIAVKFSTHTHAAISLLLLFLFSES
jgi:hypothetical protein